MCAPERTATGSACPHCASPDRDTRFEMPAGYLLAGVAYCSHPWHDQSVQRCRHGHIGLVNAGHLLHPLTLDVCDLGAEGEGDD